jgi:hypothetical protein
MSLCIYFITTEFITNENRIGQQPIVVGNFFSFDLP